MKIYLALAAFVVFIAGCKPTAQPVYFQPHNSTAVIKDTEIMPGGAILCDILGTDYYIKDGFIFLLTTKNASIVMTRIGTYTYDKRMDGWNLLPFINKDNNVYWDTLSWIEKGELDNGEKIVCRDVAEVPKLFFRFHSVYKPLYDRAAKNATSTDVL